MRAPMQQNYPKDNVLLAEWSGVGAENGAGRITPLENREAFSGSKVRIPLDLYMLQGGGWHSETGTINAPVAAEITETTVTLKRITQPASITIDLTEDSMDNSATNMLANIMKKARQALADKVNQAMNGAGDGLLGTSAGAVGSPGLTITLTAGDDYDKLRVGDVVDVLTRTTGANPGNGLRRKITAVDESALTVTFATGIAASDGDSGNLTFSSTSGIYTAGSYGQVLGGGIEAAGRGTTFQGITLATYPTFKATDGRAAVTTTAPFSENMADAGQELGLRSGAAGIYDLGVGDPAPIRVFKNGKQNQVRFNAPTGKLKSGFTGVELNVGGQTILLVPERKHKSGSVKLLRKDAATLYGRKKGPDFDDTDGSIFKRFERKWPYEFWLVDRLEWGWHDPSKILYFDNLSRS